MTPRANRAAPLSIQSAERTNRRIRSFWANSIRTLSRSPRKCLTACATLSARCIQLSRPHRGCVRAPLSAASVPLARQRLVRSAASRGVTCTSRNGVRQINATASPAHQFSTAIPIFGFVNRAVSQYSPCSSHSHGKRSAQHDGHKLKYVDSDPRNLPIACGYAAAPMRLLRTHPQSLDSRTKIQTSRAAHDNSRFRPGSPPPDTRARTTSLDPSARPGQVLPADTTR